MVYWCGLDCGLKLNKLFLLLKLKSKNSLLMWTL
nr:MAG TPA: hypothetical protein [Caudoviricetes sp.]